MFRPRGEGLAKARFGVDEAVLPAVGFRRLRVGFDGLAKEVLGRNAVLVANCQAPQGKLALHRLCHRPIF